MASSDCEGKRGNTSQMVSTFDGTFTAGPCIDRCLPEGNATIFIKGTRREINLSSNAFRSDSSGGTLHNCNPLALACSGITLPSMLCHMSYTPTHCHHY